MNSQMKHRGAAAPAGTSPSSATNRPASRFRTTGSPLGKLLGALCPVQRAAFAASVASTPGYLRHVAAGRRQLTLGMADALVSASQALPAAFEALRLTLDDLPLGVAAEHQRALREGRGDAAASAAVATARRAESPKRVVAVVQKDTLVGKRKVRFTPY